MSNTAYSDLKGAWHLDKVEALRRGEQVVPAQVQLIISDHCNQNCHFCAYRMDGGFSTELFADGTVKNPKRAIPTEKALEILTDCKSLGVQAIQFTGGGEPTAHPDHTIIFKHAQDLGMKTSLVTNGVVLRPAALELYPKMSWIRVSVDAGSAKTYSFVRDTPLSLWAKVWDHVAEVAESIRSSGSDCLLGVGYVVTMENWTELDAACRLARERGVPYVRVSAMFSEDGADYYGPAINEIRASILRVKDDLETDTFRVVNLFDDRISDLRQHAPDYSFCGYQQFNMYIGGDLNVYRCCTTSYTKHGLVGSLKDKRLADWFYSEEKRRAYADFDARSCHTCQFNNKNRVINYMRDPQPTHVEFV